MDDEVSLSRRGLADAERGTEESGTGYVKRRHWSISRSARGKRAIEKPDPGRLKGRTRLRRPIKCRRAGKRRDAGDRKRAIGADIRTDRCR